MTVAQKSDTAPSPRRLNFTRPDPQPAAKSPADSAAAAEKNRLANEEISKAARAKRALAPERHRDHPRSRPRLPEGATFHVTFNAERVEWTGTLTVGEVVINGRHGVVMGLLSKLDEKYREKLDRSAADAESPQQLASQG